MISIGLSIAAVSIASFLLGVIWGLVLGNWADAVDESAVTQQAQEHKDGTIAQDR